MGFVQKFLNTRPATAEAAEFAARRSLIGSYLSWGAGLAVWVAEIIMTGVFGEGTGMAMQWFLLFFALGILNQITAVDMRRNYQQLLRE